MIVGYAPGGATDIVGRILARRLSDVFGQQVVVDNRPGAAGTIASDLVAKATPDGYTLLFAASPEIAIAPSLYRKLPYSPEKSFVPVSLASMGPFMLVVHASIPATNVRDFVAHAKSRPSRLNFASGGSGTAIHLTGELFKATAGVDMVHVPYKGSGPAIADLIGGQVQVMFETIAVAMPHVKGGKLRTLGMATTKRAAAAPDLPTIAESGLPGFSGGTWYGVLAPAGTPRPIVARLEGESVRFFQAPETREALVARGLEPVGSTSHEFAGFIRDELGKWARVVKQAGVSID
jgi:tripartite-type tricarboxylate transporter receptor subunit TctC